MVDPQLTDYIKKANQAGQSDEQTKNLLRKNGWSDAEINEAIATITLGASLNPYNSPQQPQPQIQPNPQYQPQEQKEEQKIAPQTNMPREKKAGHPVFTLFIILAILAIISGTIYFLIAQTDLLNNLFDMFTFSTEPPVAPAVEGSGINQEPAPLLTLATVNIAAISEDYDASKITIVGFNSAGDRAYYCAQTKIGGKTSCFVNDEKSDSPYNYKPYWIETSPDGERTVFLYTDPVKKQSFTFENGEEGTRYDGTITMSKFSDDGKNFMYVVVGKDKKSFAVLDGQPFAPHDKIYSFPALSSDNRYILYGARDGQDLLWVADEIIK